MTNEKILELLENNQIEELKKQLELKTTYLMPNYYSIYIIVLMKMSMYLWHTMQFYSKIKMPLVCY